jgi:hypothetical protein
MAEWPTLGALGEPTDVIIAPPRNPARAPQGVEDAVYGMTVKPLSDIGMGIGSVVEGQGWNSPEASAGFLAAMGLLTPMRAGALRPGIKAYHGSPHDFEKFDISKIGTGEGAQAYGHGLYFAENPKTAQSYRDSLSPNKQWVVDDKVVGTYGSANTPEARAAAYLSRAMGENRPVTFADIEAAAKAMQEVNKTSPGLWSKQMLDDTYRAMMDMQGRTVGEKLHGKMYEVSIAAKPEQFLDWDAGGQKLYQDALWAHGNKATMWDQKPAAAKAASEALARAGIPGIRYLDQGSRTAADFHAMKEGDKFFAANYDKAKQAGPFNSREDAWNWINSEKQRLQTSNYVLFRDDIIDILRKYGIMAPASGVALDQATQRQ